MHYSHVCLATLKLDEVNVLKKHLKILKLFGNSLFLNPISSTCHFSNNSNRPSSFKGKIVPFNFYLSIGNPYWMYIICYIFCCLSSFKSPKSVDDILEKITYKYQDIEVGGPPRNNSADTFTSAFFLKNHGRTPSRINKVQS